MTVDLATTKLDPLIQTGVKHRPQPTMDCADCATLQRFQAFDITALIETVALPRVVSASRFARDVTIYDGSVAQGPGKSAAEPRAEATPVKATLQIFYNKDATGETDALDAAAGNPQPVSFFGLQAKKTDIGWRCSNSRWSLIEPATGTKAQRLQQDHTSIAKQMADSGQTCIDLHQTWDSGARDEDLAASEGTETLCGHLADMDRLTGIPTLDDQATIWQVNWAVATVVADDMLRKDGSQLWVKVHLEDVSGSAVVRMGEAVALQLSGFADKEAFIAAVDDGDPVLPTLLTLKIARRVRKVDAADGANDAHSFVNMTVIQAANQPFDEHRTKSTLGLVPLLRSFASMPSAILPATLSLLTPSKVYPIVVAYDPANLPPHPCRKAWVLVKATKKSKCTEDPPYVVTTDGIVEARLDASPAEKDSRGEESPAEKEYCMKILCNKSNRSAFLLTPKQGKPVYAIAILASVTQDAFFAETVEVLTVDEAVALTKAMKVEMKLAMHLLQTAATTKELAEWTTETTPAKSPVCRKLGRSPTDAAGSELRSPDKKQRVE